MNKKGFTLIELLAVIVILAIIALIATPIVLGIIEDARESSKERSAELVLNAVELAYQTKYALKGTEPSLTEVVEQLKNNGINKATVYAKGEAGIPAGVTGPAIVTNDGVVCQLTETETEKELSISCKAGSTADAKTYDDIKLNDDVKLSAEAAA